MLFPGIRIRVDQNEESEVERRGSEKNTAMRWSKGLKVKSVIHLCKEKKTRDRKKRKA